MFKDKFKVGDRVKFRPTHTPIELTGVITKVYKNEEGDLVDVKCEKDGKLVEVENHVETAHASHVELLEVHQPLKKFFAAEK